MNRYLVVFALFAATLFAVSPAGAAVLFFDGFEPEDGHTSAGPSVGTVGTNGWFITSGGGNNPSVLPFSSGLDGQAADATASGMTGGSGSADWRNDAGIAGGLTPGLEYTLSWTQKYNIGGTPNINGGLGFFNVNGINGGGAARAFIGLHSGTNHRISNPDDKDFDFANNQPDETVVDYKIVLNENEVSFFIDEILLHTTPKADWSFGDVFANASGIRTFIEGGGHYDNILLTDSTPNLVNGWRNDLSGDWNKDSNWDTLSSPSSAEESAVFGSVITTTQTVFTNTAVTVNDLQFDNANSYIVGGGGTITLADGTGGALPAPGITVAQGSHEIQAKVAMSAPVTMNVSAGQLDLNNEINTNGNTLTLSGAVNVNHSVVGGGAITTSAAVLGTAGSTGLGADLTLDGTSTLSIDIAGDLTNQFSKFDIGTNTVGLSSADLEINLDGFTPDSGDTFEILDSATLSGALGNVANGATLSTAGGEGTFVVNYGVGSAFDANSIVLSNFTASSGGILGDYDDSTVVAQGDLDIVLLNWGTANFPGNPANIPPGGGSFDGNVSQNELDGVLLNWGNTSAAGAASAVPEPSAALLLLVGGCLSLAGRRRV